MTPGWLLNLALLLVVAALALVVALKPRSDAPATYRLSDVQPKDARQIRLERKGDPPIVVERKGTGWKITEPLTARADPFQIERLLAILDATAAQRLPAQDLGRFQLAEPLTRLTIDRETFSYGAVNGVTREQYIGAGDAVYVLAPRYGAMIPANLSQLIHKQLLDESEVPVRLAFRDFTVAREANGWRVAPAKAELSQDDIQRWVDAWRYAAALRAEPYSREKPLDSIEIVLRDGRTLTLDVVQTTPELVLGRPDERLRYHFAAQAAKRLLAPPGSQD